MGTTRICLMNAEAPQKLLPKEAVSQVTPEKKVSFNEGEQVVCPASVARGDVESRNENIRQLLATATDRLLHVRGSYARRVVLSELVAHFGLSLAADFDDDEHRARRRNGSTSGSEDSGDGRGVVHSDFSESDDGSGHQSGESFDYSSDSGEDGGMELDDESGESSFRPESVRSLAMRDGSRSSSSHLSPSDNRSSAVLGYQGPARSQVDLSSSSGVPVRQRGRLLESDLEGSGCRGGVQEENQVPESGAGCVEQPRVESGSSNSGASAGPSAMDYLLGFGRREHVFSQPSNVGSYRGFGQHLVMGSPMQSFLQRPVSRQASYYAPWRGRGGSTRKHYSSYRGGYKKSRY